MQITHDGAWEQFLDEFTDVFSIFDLRRYKIFICGSYKNKSYETLLAVKNLINQKENYLGFLEKEFRRTHIENLIYKFDIIAKFADKIIMIIDHDRGGHMIEMGIILSVKEFNEKTIVFVDKNSEITEVLKRGGLLTPFFEENRNLFYFEDFEQLKSQLNS